MNIRCFPKHFTLSSQPLRHVPLPSLMEAHLWVVVPDEIKSSSLLNQYLEILSPTERDNVLTMQDDQLRKRAILARILVRTTIARYQRNPQVRPESLKFRKNIYGKPEVEWPHADDWSPPPLQFNISHSSSLIACGVAVNSSIGIDVEEKSRTIKRDIISFARRFFCHQEVEQLAQISDPEAQRQEFIKLWTLKEAYVKALGWGFSAAPFNTFRIHFRSPSLSWSHLLQNTDHKASEIVAESIGTEHLRRNWKFGLLEVAADHYVAICMEEEKERSPITLRVWRTIPFVEDECLSGTSSVVTIGGFVKQLGSSNANNGP